MRQTLALLLLALAACSGGGATAPAPSPSTPPTASVFASGSAAADRMCETDLPAIGERLLALIRETRVGARTGAELSQGFLAAQDEVTVLAAEVTDLQSLHVALVNYADTLGRLRVSGAGGVEALTDSVQGYRLECVQRGSNPFN